MRLDPVAPDGGLRYTDWSNVPYLNRWDDDRQLKLNDNWADNRNDNWSSPRSTVPRSKRPSERFSRFRSFRSHGSR